MTRQDVLTLRASLLIDLDANCAFMEPFFSAHEAQVVSSSAKRVSTEKIYCRLLDEYS